jgi:hypothetical protein
MSMSAASRAKVVRFPSEKTVHPARGGTDGKFAARVRRWGGRVLTLFGAPGAIRSTEIEDEVAGQRVAVLVGEVFVCISVNGRDYYFDRFNGRFDGTGSSAR